MIHFKLPQVLLILLVAATLVLSQGQPNLQTFSERVFGQRVPEVVRSGNRFSVVVFNQVRSTSSDLRSALRTSCDTYLNICFMGGRRQTSRAWSMCSSSAHRCRNSIPESIRRAGSQTGSAVVSSTPASAASTTAAQPGSTSTSATLAAPTSAAARATTTSSSSSASASASATATASSANNLVDPALTGTTAASTSPAIASSSTTATLASANAVPTPPGSPVEVAPPALTIPDMSQFCAQVGQAGALADGTQKRTSTCSQTAQGQIPAFERMVSTLIVQPENGATIQRGSTVPFACTTSNMETGFFDDPQRLYYAVPQTLNAEGVIQGHQHISVQRIASTATAPDPRSESLSFFVGLNTRADAQGVHTATIPATTFTQPGVYRICTITGTRGHQPVIMPVARRGSQDDCIRVTVA